MLAVRLLPLRANGNTLYDLSQASASNILMDNGRANEAGRGHLFT
jgi:hypothetical protein